MITTAINTNATTELVYPKPLNKWHKTIPKSHLQVLNRAIPKMKLITDIKQI